MTVMRIPIILLLVSLSANSLFAQTSTTKERLERITQTPEIADFFKGIFNHLGIEIAETGEKLTLHHEGSKITIENGLVEHKVDFILPLRLQNITNLENFAADGKFDDVEATNVARVFFTPFTRVTLKNEVLSENKKRKAAGIEDLIHVYLLYPNGDVAAAHTLVYVSDQWLVLDEVVGNPKRVFKLTQAPALDYQRKIFEAMQTNTNKGWLSFLSWYKEWRKVYSETRG